MDQQNQVQPTIVSSEGVYTPSSVEKKRALMMYFLFGIIIVISDKKVKDFEFFHVKQAMGWWMVFILSVLVSSIVLFIPIIRFVGILRLFLIMILFAILAKQAWDGKYYMDITKYGLGVFSSLGAWLFGLFGIEFNVGEQLISDKPILEQPITSNEPISPNKDL